MSTEYHSLEKLFHEPNRLAIMSAVCGAADGLSFSELKEVCELTDGNLSRHLKALEEAKAVKIKKQFVDSKPNTSVRVTDKGREKFLDYLGNLEKVLKSASKAAKKESKVAKVPLNPLAKTT